MDNFVTHQRKTNAKPEIAFFNKFPLSGMINMLTFIKFSIAPIQIVFKRNSGHFVVFFLLHNHITEIPLKVEFTENAIF